MTELAQSWLALVEVAGAAAASTAAVTATSEVGDPASPPVGVGSGSVRVAAAVPPAGVQPAPAADVPRGGARAGTASLGRGESFLGGGLLCGGLGDQICLHPLSQLHSQLGVAGLGTVHRVAHPVGDHDVQDLMWRGTRLPGQQIAGVDHSTGRELDADCLANHIQLVHDVEHPLPGDVPRETQEMYSNKYVSRDRLLLMLALPRS